MITRVLALSAALVALAPLPAHAAEAATCRGLPATIVATSGAVVGTAGDDVIVVSGSVTEVDPGVGSDTVCLDGVRATVHAGAGDTGDDVVDTTGNRELEATVELGGGANTFVGGGGEDTVLIGSDSAPSTDTIDTGTDHDVVEQVGGVAALSLVTGSGADELRLTAPPVTGTVDLGSGVNRLEVLLPAQRHGQPAVTVDAARDRLRIGDRRLRVTGARDVLVSARTATLVGDAKADVLRANACRATIRAGGGDDLTALVADSTRAGQHCGDAHSHQYSGTGDDVLRGLGGADVLVGGPGRDRAFGNGGVDRCSAEVTGTCEHRP